MTKSDKLHQLLTSDHVFNLSAIERKVGLRKLKLHEWVNNKTYLDTAGAPYNTPLLGCELLKERIELIKPKIHVCGHIHGGYGYYYNGHTHFFNASILDERYNYANKPFHFEWDPITNQITWL